MLFNLNFWYQSETWNLVGVIVVLIFVGYLLQKSKLKAQIYSSVTHYFPIIITSFTLFYEWTLWSVLVHWTEAVF